MSNDQPGMDSLGEGWLTIAEAAETLEVSAKTIRRRLKAGEITGELVYDPKIGAERWMIDAEALPTAPGVALIPVELLDRLEDAWRQAREAAAEAAKAEQRADFEKDRRQRTEARLETVEGDWRQAREAAAEAAKAEQRADFEKDRRQRTEARLETVEGDRTRLAHEVTRLRGRHQSEMSRRWWRRRNRG